MSKHFLFFSIANRCTKDGWLKHVPPFLHGLLQYGPDCEQIKPQNSVEQEQVKLLIPVEWQVPWLKHGTEEHGFNALKKQLHIWM